MKIDVTRHELIDLILACDMLYNDKDGNKWKEYGDELRLQLAKYDQRYRFI